MDIEKLDAEAGLALYKMLFYPPIQHASQGRVIFEFKRTNHSHKKGPPSFGKIEKGSLVALIQCPADEERLERGNANDLPIGTVVQLTLKPFVVRVCFNRMPEIIDFKSFMSLVLLPD